MLDYQNIEWLKRQLYNLERENQHRTAVYESKKKTFENMIAKTPKA